MPLPWTRDRLLGAQRSYREAILAAEPRARFVLLDGLREFLEQRRAHRHGHFMHTSLLDSQLATLEPLGIEEPGVTVSIERSPEEIAHQMFAALHD